MTLIRTALLIVSVKSQSSKSFRRKLAFVLLFIFTLLVPQTSSGLDIIPFQDIPKDVMYKNYIEDFQKANIIVGDTQGGQPVGKLRPNDFIQRAEFAKIAALVRLLEDRHQEGAGQEYQSLNLNEFTLKTNTDLIPYYSSKEIHFTDVPDKEASCAQNPAGCEPWFGQYVNYAAHKGLLKGFPDGKFYPAESILRIHALKLIMAQDGNLPATSDPKFKALSSDPRIKNVTHPKCLKGAEPHLIKNNGGYSQDSYNLLSYAILADKLDLFGSECQLFNEYNAVTPEQRAAMLQKPLTRKEIARYFALTTKFPLSTIDPSVDPTTSTQAENGMNFYEEGYTPMVHPPEMIKKSIPEKIEPEKILGEKKEAPISLKTPQEKALMSVPELIELNQQGRCCPAMTLSSECGVVKFNDYSIAEESSYNFGSYDGGLWQKATRPGHICWIPFGDILNGYAEGGDERTCSFDQEGDELMDYYLNAYLKVEVTRIWTAEESNALKFYRQLSLDMALKTSKELKKLVESSKPDCKIIDAKLVELKKAHQSIYN